MVEGLAVPWSSGLLRAQQLGVREETVSRITLRGGAESSGFHMNH